MPRARLIVPLGVGPCSLDTLLARGRKEFERMYGRFPTTLRFPRFGDWPARLAPFAGSSELSLQEDPDLAPRALVFEV